MNSESLLHQLSSRSLIAQITDTDGLDELLAKDQVTLYCGFDPTADSLHLGHLVPLLTLKRFQMAGHTPIALVGGATGLIGDPSFKSNERVLNPSDVVDGWVEKIKQQVSQFLDFDCGNNSAVIVNNYDWFGQMNVLTFLRDVGKHFSVNAMINKESVQQRINRPDIGISFTEFSYSLLQAYDFAQLNGRYNCQLQLGGSDQWGNITAGIDLTRRLNHAQCYGITMPLITKSDGTKFGKSEGNAVWLDPKKTSPYKFYQFWLNTADEDVYRFMRFFTFMSLSEIHAIEEQDRQAGGAPQAQAILAEKATELVHGSAAALSARHISQSLFRENVDELTEGDFEQLALDGVPHTDHWQDGRLLIDALVEARLADSKSQARAFIEQGAVMVNGSRVGDLAYRLDGNDRRFGRYTMLARGKKLHNLLIWAA